MKYDATDIPAGYDKARNHGPKFIELWMSTLADYAKGSAISWILDLGCGTGRFSDAMATFFDASVVGVDPSRRMIDQAARKSCQGRVRYVIGAGEAIPVMSRSMDMILMSMVFHHFQDSGRVAHECRRIGRPHATIFVRTGTLDRALTYPYVPFFPESIALMRERLPRVTDIQSAFEAAAFRTVAARLVEQQIASSYAEYADKLAAGADSILAALNADQLQKGLRALRAHAASAEPQAITEQIDFLVFA